MAPISVTSTPSEKAASSPPTGSGRPTTSTARVDDRKPIIAAASAMPADAPRRRCRAAPAPAPGAGRCPSTWREVVPAARSSPSSRVRSPTVMASVLPTRNAPTTSATEAEQQRDADEALLRRGEPRRGIGRRLDHERLVSLAVDARRSRSASGRRRGRGRCSGSATGTSNAASSVSRAATMTSPPSRAARPVSAMSPTIRSGGTPCRRPERSSSSPRPSPFRAAHEAGTSASVGAVGRQRHARDEARSRIAASIVRIDARAPGA